MEPETQDIYTDDPLHENWTLYQGSDLTVQAGGKVGSHYVRANGEVDDGKTYVQVGFEFPEILHVGLHGQYSLLGVYLRTPILPLPNKMQINLYSLVGHYQTEIIKYLDTGWEYFEFPLGITQTYSDDYPDGIWHKTGKPQWLNITHIEFYQVWDNEDTDDRIEIDDLWFKPKRSKGTDSSEPSQTAYGKRDFEVIEDRLRTNTDCANRAKTLLYQKMYAPIQIEVTVKPGNNNILVGDQLSITIPAENINTQPYDVLSVEHRLTREGFFTTATMVNSSDIREPLETSELRRLINQRKALRKISTNSIQIGT